MKASASRALAAAADYHGKVAAVVAASAVPGADGAKISVHLGEQPTSLEPAAQIDDESERQKAVEQNDNDGAVYDDPWYGAPEWARFKAQDSDGEWRWFEYKPSAGESGWVEPSPDGRVSCEEATCDPNPNWRDTLIERPVGQDPQE